VCHGGIAGVREIRVDAVTDWDGDGDAAEPLADEVDDLRAALLAEIQLAAVSGGGEAICYDGESYPYFFADTDGSGDCDATEADHANAFDDWTAALMRAAFNYQLAIKDGGAWAHNLDYTLQLLIDSIDDLGGDTAAYTRP
jgi:hypothetical protein